MANDAEESDYKVLVIQGRRGSEVLYLDGPPTSCGSWRPTPAAMNWPLGEVKGAELYLAQVKAQVGQLGGQVADVRLVVWPLEAAPARVPSPPPEAVSPASEASALSPSPHSAATNRERTEGGGSPTSHPEPPGARETGEAGEAGDGGDLPRREPPVTVPSREGSRSLSANLMQREAPQALAPRSWGTRDFPVVSRRR